MNEVALRGVSVRFGKVHALDAVDLVLRPGQVACLAGPNGAGKSTLVRVLLGLVRAEHGGLSVDGVPSQVDNTFKTHIGYLPEAVAFSDNLSGRQVLRFFARARGVGPARVAAVLETVGLKAAARRAVRGYSRGMRQRLGLGIAILAEPQILVLDEPTSGLDQEGLALLWTVLDAWRAAGRMVLMSSHELTLVERRIDQLTVMRAGVVCASDTPARLREAADLPVRVTFTVQPGAAALQAAIGDWPGCLSLRRVDDRLVAEVRPKDLLGLVDLRAAHPTEVVGLRVEEPGLDLVYERLLERGA